MNRKCFICQAPISACMGYVCAGDFLKAVEGTMPPNEIKETCGKCVNRKDALELLKAASE